MPRGGMLEVGYGLAYHIKCEGITSNDEIYFRRYLWFSRGLYDRLTHTPDITSGRGWTLVNVGFSWRFRHLDEKWVYGWKNEKMGRRQKNEGGTLFFFFLVLITPIWTYSRGKSGYFLV